MDFENFADQIKSLLNFDTLEKTPQSTNKWEKINYLVI